ncbi:MAG: bactofilin family protein [Myxococcota bacterium]
MARTPFGSKGREEGSDSGWSPPSAPSGSSSTPGGLTAFIDQGSEFEGKLSFKDTVRIDGRFRGEISSENTLIVGESGEIEATIRSKTVAVSGTVVGDIHATDKVVVHKTGRVEGNIEAKTLVVEEGAVIEGSVKMGKGGSLKSIDGGAKAPAGEPKKD